MIRLIIWLVFFYAIYHLVKTLIRSAVNRGIRDYEAQKEALRHKEKEVKIDRKDIEDAKYEDLS